MQYIITDETLNRIVGMIEERPFRQVIALLNEIKAAPVEETIEAKPAITDIEGVENANDH